MEVARSDMSSCLSFSILAFPLYSTDELAGMRHESSHTYYQRGYLYMTVPTHLEITRVSEVDYRPVFILPALSKEFERLVLKQLTSHDKQSLLPSNVLLFRKGFSATIVLLAIRDDLILAMKRGGLTLMVL